MIAETLRALRTTQERTETIDIAKGRYKYPETFNELIKALKWLLRKK